MPEVGAIFRDLHADHGVELHLGVGVESFRGTGSAEEVELADGSAVAGDLFVAGIGVVPRTELADGARLHLDNGVVVDEHLATSVAGDLGGRGRRHGHFTRCSAPAFASSTGRLRSTRDRWRPGTCSANTLRTTKIPYFFSDQYELGMEYSGFAPDWDSIVFRGDVGSREVRRLLAG